MTSAKVAFWLLKNLTPFATTPSRFVPKMVTAVPAGPALGLEDVIVGAHAGAAATVKLAALVPGPVPFVTVRVPVPLAPPGTATRISLSDMTWTVFCVAGPGKVTDVTAGLLRFVPLMVTTHPTGPDEGENVMFAGTTAMAGAAIAIRSSDATRTTPPTQLPRCRLYEAMTSSLSGGRSRPRDSHTWLFFLPTLGDSPKRCNGYRREGRPARWQWVEGQRNRPPSGGRFPTSGRVRA